MKINQLSTFALLLASRLCVVAAPDVVSLWGGARGTIILKSDGTVWTWGANSPGGKLGLGRRDQP